MTAIFVTEARSKNIRTRCDKIVSTLSANRLQGRKGNIATPKSTPTNMSATVKFITKHVLLLRRFLFLVKTMIVRRLTDTMITDSVTNIANQTIHSDVIQLFRERLSEKVHATIPKGIVGGFVSPVLQRNLKEWHERPRTYVREC